MKRLYLLTMLPVDYLAFEIGEALGDERRRDARGRDFGEAERRELVDVATR